MQSSMAFDYYRLILNARGRMNEWKNVKKKYEGYPPYTPYI
jgi:hypothetical protein